MPLTLPRRVTFVAKAEYFTTPGIKGWFQKTFFSGAGQVPIDRSGAAAAEGALISAKRILDEGELFGIYPEGTRSHDGRLYRGKTGVARLALETGVPVIPVAVIGTDVVAPPGKKFGSFTRPMVRFGKPLDFSRYEGMENDRYILRSITDEIMYEIMRLSGQEYVDMYATKAKASLEKEAPPTKAAADVVATGTASGGTEALSDLDRPAVLTGRRPRRTGAGPPSARWSTPLFRALAVLRVVVLRLRGRCSTPAGATSSSTPSRAGSSWSRHGRLDRFHDLGVRRRRAGADGCCWWPTWPLRRADCWPRRTC